MTGPNSNGVELDSQNNTRLRVEDVVRVTHAVPIKSLAGSRVIELSLQSAVIRTDELVPIGQRLSFHFGDDRPPVLTQVCAVEKSADGYLAHCTCLLGGFDAA